MRVLDIIVRGVFFPLIWMFIIHSVPGLKEDLKKWFSLYVYEPEKKVRRTRKTVQVQTMPVVLNSNSFCKYVNYSSDFIITQK